MASKPPGAASDHAMNYATTKNTQASGQRRSRTGCITCKIRRVKCDETRPECKRCISTGRTCDGYPSAGLPSQHQTRRALAAAVRELHVAGPASRVLGKPLPIDDVACFDFFRLCTASMTGSVFPGEKFWSRQMLQAAHIEPAAWRAVVALGALHRRWEYSNNCLSPRVTRRGGPDMIAEKIDVNIFTQQAIKHYAVSLSLAKGISDLAMLAIISVALGAAAHLAGKWSDSQVHIRAGFKLLREIQTSKSAVTTGNITLLPADLEGAAQALERLDAQAMTLSDVTSPYEYTKNDLKESKLILVDGSILPDNSLLHQRPTSIIGPMNDLGQAALAIFRMMRQFFITANAVATGALTPYEFELARLQMLEAASQWESELGVLIDIAESKFNRHKSDRDQKVLILSLKLYHTTIELMLLAHGEPPPPACVETPAGIPENLTSQPASKPPDQKIPTSETQWDALHPHFLQIVKLASEIAHNTDSPLPFFMSLEPGLAIPLYLTVKSCRHPITRRRALGLLRRLNRQEGIWNCALAARAAEELVLLEEEGILCPSTSPTNEHAIRTRTARDTAPVTSTPENLLLPLDFFERDDHEETNEALLSQLRENAVQRFKRFHREECLRQGKEVDPDIKLGQYEGQRFPQPYWGDGWPNIPEERRILVQYPTIRIEENQLKLMMVLVGDTKGGRGRLAKKVVVDMF